MYMRPVYFLTAARIVFYSKRIFILRRVRHIIFAAAGRWILIGAAVLLLTLPCSCKREKVLSKNKMAEIIGEMYVLNEYAKGNVEFDRRSDSTLMYSPIFRKHGCTLEEYQNSLRYYVADNDSYYKILVKAGQILKSHLDMIGGGGGTGLWIEDSLRRMGAQALSDNPHLRALHWLMAQDEYGVCGAADKCSTDIPQNSEWWQNNLKQSTIANFVEDNDTFKSVSAQKQNPDINVNNPPDGVFLPDGGTTDKEVPDNGNPQLTPQENAKAEKIKKDFRNGAAPDGTVDKTDGKKIQNTKRAKMTKEQMDRMNREIKEERPGGWVHR